MNRFNKQFEETVLRDLRITWSGYSQRYEQFKGCNPHIISDHELIGIAVEWLLRKDVCIHPTTKGCIIWVNRPCKDFEDDYEDITLAESTNLLEAVITAVNAIGGGES